MYEMGGFSVVISLEGYMDNHLLWVMSLAGCIGWGLAGWLAYRIFMSPVPKIRSVAPELSFNYTNSRGENSDHTIKDVIAYQASGNIYIDGQYDEDDERYTFRADRIQALEHPLTGQTVLEKPYRWLSARAAF
jgi:hypothetical protein